MTWRIECADCLDAMRAMDAESVEAIVCDPPYGLGFMGRDWDHGVPGAPYWEAALRVARPGAHLLAFGGTRTFHRLACAIEDAGWEMRDTIMWTYGSGFPKSRDISKAIDAEAGAERALGPNRVSADGTVAHDAAGRRHDGYERPWRSNLDTVDRDTRGSYPATEEAKRWDGWGTALKPAWEPILVARKPLAGTVAANTLAHGTGGLNIDACRVECARGDVGSRVDGDTRSPRGNPTWCNDDGSFDLPRNYHEHKDGRWPANLVHDGSPEVVRLFPAMGNAIAVDHRPPSTGLRASAARFYYCAKASKRDRDEGCEALERRTAAECTIRKEGSAGLNSPRAGAGRTSGSRNTHPTVKPTDLMRWLVRLVTPPGGTVLDPFAGSGSTGKAAALEGFHFIGIEIDPAYCEIARARIRFAEQAGALPLFERPEDGGRRTEGGGQRRTEGTGG